MRIKRVAGAAGRRAAADLRERVFGVTAQTVSPSILRNVNAVGTRILPIRVVGKSHLRRRKISTLFRKIGCRSPFAVGRRR